MSMTDSSSRSPQAQGDTGHATYGDYKAMQRSKLRTWSLVGAVILIGYVWSTFGTGFNPVDFVRAFGTSVVFIVTEMLPPDLSIIPRLVGPALDTLYMSYVAAIACIFLSIPIGLLGARQTRLGPISFYAARILTAFVRSLPSLILAIFLVAIMGIGAVAGTFAMAIGGVGILGKLYYEAIDTTSLNQITGINAAGGTWLQKVGQGVWPQARPALVTWSLFRLDLNIRSAAVLGLVGAGGIGFDLDVALKLFQYQQATTIILVIFVMVIMVEAINGTIRKYTL
jgi:phosphonate transport system permease protein